MKKRILIALIVLLQLAGMAFVALAENGVSEKWVSEEAARAAAKYWTKERMMSAKPYPMPTKDGAPPEADSAINPLDMGEPGTSPAGLPQELKGSTSADDILEMLETEPAFDVNPRGYPYPPPQTTLNLFNQLYSVSPLKAVGKVFFRGYDGLNYVCSGASIGGRAVLTAGHCVSDGYGHFHSNWTFVPSYKAGNRPYGTWSSFWLSTSTAWHMSHDYARDVGFAAVNNIAGLKLSQKVGYLGFAWNWTPSQQHWTMFGYPSAAPYTGNYMVETQASHAVSDTSESPATSGAGTDQTPGCSGGPWIRKFGNGNYANGVFSYFYTAQPKQMFTPYFDTWVHDVLFAPAIIK